MRVSSILTWLDSSRFTVYSMIIQCIQGEAVRHTDRYVTERSRAHCMTCLKRYDASIYRL